MEQLDTTRYREMEQLDTAEMEQLDTADTFSGMPGKEEEFVGKISYIVI